jgi:hypothetical protein
MTDYLARLKARISEKALPQAPSKPPKAPFEGFEGAQGRGIFEIGAESSLEKRLSDQPSKPSKGHEAETTDELAERAALVEYGAGVPRDWAEGFARLDRTCPPNGFSALRWQTVINDGGRFLDRWAADAADLGWQASDVFGVHPMVPSCRYDQMGLVLLVNGGDVAFITATSANIRTTVGSVLTYTRLPKDGAVCIWELKTGLGEAAQ